MERVQRSNIWQFIFIRKNSDILPLSDGEIWTAHGGVNPCGLIVRR
jgi:hypothetical protein